VARRALPVVALFVLFGGCGGGASPAPNEVIDVQGSEADEGDPSEDEVGEVSSDAPTGEACVKFADRLEHCTKRRFGEAAAQLGPEHEQEVARLRAAALDGVEVVRKQCGGPMGEDDARYLARMARCVALSCDDMLDCVRQVDGSAGEAAALP
jgi:hypothetical protein